MEADDINPIIRQKVNRLVQGSMQRFETIIDQGIANSELKDSWNRREFGIKAFAMIEGGAMISRVSQSNGQIGIIIKAIKKKLKKIAYNYFFNL